MNTKTVLFALTCTLCAACSSPSRIIWTEGPVRPDSGNATHRMDIVNPPSGTDWTVWFSQFRTPVTMEEDAPASIEHIAGTLYCVIPATEASDTMTLLYRARPLANRCRAPEGFYLQRKGEKPVLLPVEYVWQPADPVQSFTYTPMPTSAYDMVPRLKDVTPIPGTTDLGKATVQPVRYVQGQVPGWYRITVDGDVTVEAADGDGAHYAGVTLGNLRRNAAGDPVQNGVVTDWPDLSYRGIMLDVSRNFTKKENLLKLIDLLSHYKASYLHLHFGDDEGWRIEIDALPELTSFGAFREIPQLNEDGTIDEKDALMPTYCVAASRDDLDSPANGYYSHADFVEILRYAWARRIRVIPEFDTPGHSRAAIKAMDVRAERTGDASCRLSEPEDTSSYVSVQDYTDNAINVALPSTYRFIETVFDGLIALYAEAGAPLDAIHVGGDEVPEGAWEGSPACRALMEANGKTDFGWLKEYYIGRVLDIAEAKGVKLAGWQEVAQHLGPATFDRLRNNLAFTNLWAVSRGRDELAYQFANEGINVVLSNSSNNYFDFAYNDSKLERGHNWGGYVDERRSFSLLPFNMYRSVRWDDRRRLRDLSRDGVGKVALQPEGRPHIVGVQGQLWSETLRNFDHVTYYLFPKACGLFERGWNASPAWEQTTVADDPAFVEDFNAFFSIIVDHEYPYYEAEGVSYHKN
ncbi:MAG: family 20 glycosylhydrolase [Bacteroidales bacterium]|nr:family 20 glycosylhydrolase [Bacteroidales bacterium]